MSEKKKLPSDNKEKFSWVKVYFASKAVRIIISMVLIFLVIAGVAAGIKKYVESEAKTTKIGFEDIGELATQVAYSTEVNVTDASRKLFGMTIPFTQSKYIYSYDVIVKAGFDFTQVEWSEKNEIIEVKLPKAEILSCEVDTESFQVYHEDESIFRRITLEENNEALNNLKQQAQDDAIENGILENARANVETILKGFFGNAYNLEKYKIKFVNL